MQDYTYFKPDFTLEYKKYNLHGDFYIKLLGNFNYCVFMNDFVNVIKEYYKGQKEPCFIKNIKKNYKCLLIFQKK